MIIGKKERRQLGKGDAPEDIQVEVKAILQEFQAGYSARDVNVVDEYVDKLFSNSDVLVLGTSENEYCLNLPEVKKLIEGDWKHWGDVSIDIEGAHISAYGDVAWVTTEGIIAKTVTADELTDGYVEGLKETLKDELTAKEKIVESLRTISVYLHDAQFGEEILRPFRFTAILVNEHNMWKFRHIHFSHSTVWPSDVRIIGDIRVC